MEHSNDINSLVNNWKINIPTKKFIFSYIYTEKFSPKN